MARPCYLSRRLDVFLGRDKEIAAVAVANCDFDVLTRRGLRKLRRRDPFLASDVEEANSGLVKSPMPGTIRQVYVAEGSHVKRGDPLLVMEAMKMEHILRAPSDGVVTELNCAEGDVVKEGVDLVTLESQ